MLDATWLFDGREVPHLPVPPPGPRAQAYLDRDDEFVSPSYTRVYPLVVARGSGCVIEDVDHNLYLDFTAGIAVTATGHCHPHVVAAIQDQASKLLHMSGTDFYYAPQVDLAQRLAEAVGPGRRVFFTNSGTESLEAALKLSRKRTGRSRVISFFGSFHGRTYGGMSLSGSKLVHRRGFGPLVPDIHHVPYPKAGESGAACVAAIEDTVLKRTAPPEEVAAVFVEPIQGEGGYRVPPPDFLPALRALCDKHGIMLVADEVQSGMGRTGKMFACQHFGIEPDIVCLAKGIASGMPLGAIVSKSEIMDWPPGSHASTFGGNPVSCRAALATMDLLEAGYTRNAHERGEQLRTGLKRLAARHGEIGDVRGLGLMTAMDLPSDRCRNEVVQEAFVRGLLLLGCGESAIRFCPPLCVTAAQVETCLGILDGVLLR
ncbi:MAG: acetyl ornithine aminotransferase family protein [Gemmataceae bacterium]|nr:acetyl ornithine aminotransferase family protein [Gemmataceae bacterium]